MNAPSLNELLQNYSANRLQLQAEGIYYLRDVDEETAERYSRDMLLMALAREGRPESPITVYVNSPGGSGRCWFCDDGNRPPRAPHSQSAD